MKISKNTFYLYPLLFALFLMGCTRDIVLELPYVPPRLVLNASVVPGQDVAAYLSKSWFLLDSVPDSTAPEGTIRVYINNQFRGKMQLRDFSGDSIRLKGQYYLPGCRVSAGDRLRLTAEAAGFDPVEAETAIPDEVQIAGIDSSRFVVVEGSSRDNQMRLYIRFQDNPDKRNFYRLIVEKVTEYQKGDSLIVTSSFDPWSKYYDFSFNLLYEDPVFQNVATNPTLGQLDARTCRGTFTDDIFDGEEYTVKTVFSPVLNSYQDDTIRATVHYDIRLMSVSEDYYHYLTVIRNFSITFGDAYDNALLEPSMTYTNVKDGFGVVAGYQVAYKRITMPLGDEPPFFDPFNLPY